MARFVALFRGINVGGHNRVPMAELRETITGLGLSDVASIIQSGNVCFTVDDGDRVVVVERIRAAVAERFDVDVPVLLRDAAEISEALAAHPFGPEMAEPKLHHIHFLADAAPDDAAELLGDHRPGADYVIDGDRIHVVYPEGSARSKFTVDLVDRRLGTTATARNLPTVDKIAAELAVCLP